MNRLNVIENNIQAVEESIRYPGRGSTEDIPLNGYYTVRHDEESEKIRRILVTGVNIYVLVSQFHIKKYISEFKILKAERVNMFYMLRNVNGQDVAAWSL